MASVPLHPNVSEKNQTWLAALNLKKTGIIPHSLAAVADITRLARGGVPEQQAMRFIGHATLEVHRVYQKLKTDDLAACVAVLNHPCAA